MPIKFTFLLNIIKIFDRVRIVSFEKAKDIEIYVK